MLNKFVPTYGNWGGPGYSGGRRPKSIKRNRWRLAPPIDDADEAFMLHDFDYEEGKYLHGDRALLERLGDPAVFSYPWLAKNVFRVMSKARELGILDPGIEPNPGPRPRLAQRLKHLPNTHVGGEELAAPAYPSRLYPSSSQRFSLASNTLLNTNATLDVFTMNGSTTATYRDAPLPFVVGSNSSGAVEVFSIKGNKVMRFTLKGTLSSVAAFGANQYVSLIFSTFDGNSLIERVTQDVPLISGATGTKFCTTAFMSLSPGRSVAVGIKNNTAAFTIDAPGTLIDFSAAVDGDNAGSNLGGLWVPFTDQQKGLPSEGVKERGTIRPWEPPKTQSEPLLNEGQDKMNTDPDESEDDDSTEEYASDTSDEVERILREVKSGWVKRKQTYR